MKIRKIRVRDKTYQHIYCKVCIGMFDHVSNKFSSDLVMEVFNGTHNQLRRNVHDLGVFQIKLNLPL
jgi:hypothetical protein